MRAQAAARLASTSAASARARQRPVTSFNRNRLVKHRVDGRDGGFWSEAVS
jgi:hypothetical protein